MPSYGSGGADGFEHKQFSVFPASAILRVAAAKEDCRGNDRTSEGQELRCGILCPLSVPK
jgi:hypothetical protein